MRLFYVLILTVTVSPSLAFAQTSLQTLLGNLLGFVNTVIIPFLFGIAFLFFIINVVRYFVAGGGSEEKREKARMLALYGVLALVLIIIFWGLVNLFASSIGLSGKEPVVSDYVEQENRSNNSTTPADPPADNNPTDLIPPGFDRSDPSPTPTPPSYVPIDSELPGPDRPNPYYPF